MRVKVKFFGTEEELRDRLMQTNVSPTKLNVRGYALDNEVEMDVDEKDYYEICDALGLSLIHI